MTDLIPATYETADALALAADLPRTMYYAQDGGYFYLFASRERDTDWRDIGSNPSLMVVVSGIDPDFDQLDLCEQLREQLLASLPSFTLIWDI